MAFECTQQQVKDLSGYLDNGDIESFQLRGETVFRYPQSSGADFGKDLNSLGECMRAIDRMEQKGVGLDIKGFDSEFNRFELTNDAVRCGKQKKIDVYMGTN